MAVQIEAYAIISGINLLLIISGAGIVILGKHLLMQWRLNKPVQAQKTP